MLSLTYAAGSGLGQRFQILPHQRQEAQGKEGGGPGGGGAGKLLTSSEHLLGDRRAVSQVVRDASPMKEA